MLIVLAIAACLTQPVPEGNNSTSAVSSLPPTTKPQQVPSGYG